MIVIQTSDDMASLLSGPVDPDLKTILLDRLELLAEYLEQWPLEDLLTMIVLEPADSMETLEGELGISPFKDALGEIRFPDPRFEPSWEFCIARKGYFDFTFALCDSGLGIVLLVPDQDGLEPELLKLCRTYATP